MHKQDFIELVNMILGEDVRNRDLFDVFIDLDRRGKLDNQKLYKLIAVLLKAVIDADEKLGRS